MKKPRNEHYFFSHLFLKAFYYSYYDKFNSELLQEKHDDMNSFIRFLWQEFQRISNFVVSEVNGYDELSLEVNYDNDDMELWVVTMPEPEIKTEAYYVGFFFNRNLYYTNLIPLFFTLEYSDQNNCFFCYWDEQDKHHNLGLLEPTKNSFIQNIRNCYQNIITEN